MLCDAARQEEEKNKKQDRIHRWMISHCIRDGYELNIIVHFMKKTTAVVVVVVCMFKSSFHK